MTTQISFPGGSEVKASACIAGDLGSIPGLGRFPGEGNGCPLQYSSLENSLDRGAWQATVHGVAKEMDLTEHTHTTTIQQEIDVTTPMIRISDSSISPP